MLTNLNTMFLNSTVLADLLARINGDAVDDEGVAIAGQDDVGQVLLDTQIAVNSFIGEIGSLMKTSMWADTYLMNHTFINTDSRVFFTICATLWEPTNRIHQHVLFNFEYVKDPQPSTDSGLSLVRLTYIG